MPYLAFALFKIPLPLTIIQILAVDLGTDMIPALGLGSDKPDAQSMTKPPRAHDERLLDWKLLFRAYFFLGLLEAAIAMSAYFFVLHNGQWQWGMELAMNSTLYLQATTACFSAIIVSQIANVFLCKVPTHSIFQAKLTDNPIILLGIAIEILLLILIDYTPWGNLIFGTASLDALTWFIIIPMTLVILGLEKFRKFLVRK